MFQQLAFVDVVKAMDSKHYEILKFSRNILHLKSYIERVTVAIILNGLIYNTVT
jgi:hypothetical protein